MSAQDLVAASGRRVEIGTKLGAGGEGSVFEVRGKAVVAKVYSAPPTLERVAKLDALVRMQAPELGATAAWPLETLTSRGRVSGFLMPRLEECVPLSRILIPRTRKADFPAASWAWLVHVARNLAIAVDTVHQAGVVIGDVNESNFLVGRDTSVRLIDVDSFQVQDGRRTFTCDVGVPMFTPPELQGRAFAGLVRNVDHDRFGLAVLIFQLIFMGRHPWSGVYAGPELSFQDGEVIRRLPFAWGKDAREAGFSPPAGSVRLDSLPSAAAECFERAFTVRGDAPLRPSGSQWAEILETFERELAPCDVTPVHRYVPSRGPCPWCFVEHGSPPLYYFIAPVASPSEADFLDVDPLERALLATELLQPQPLPFDVAKVPRPKGYDLPADLRAQRRTWWIACAACAVLLLVLELALGARAGSPAALLAFAGLVLFRPRLDSVRAFRRAAASEAKLRYERLTAEWGRLSDPAEFPERKRALLEAVAAYRSLPLRYEAELEALERQRPTLQLQRYLRQFSLEDAKIAGIGKKRKALLRAYGHQTAADVADILRAPLPGFGTTYRYALLAWYEHLRSGFRHDPGAPLDATLLNDLRARQSAERGRLEAFLRGGQRTLEAAMEQRRAERDDLTLPLEAAAYAYAKAKADVRRVSLRPFA